MPTVRANLVVGRNGMTTKAGSSKALSSSADRKQFHRLRSLAQVILIGGSTFRSEPYSEPPLPLHVSTRSKLEPTEKARFFNLSPSQLLNQALEAGFEQVLIEGGVNFLATLISESRIDEIHLTRAQVDGDADFFDERELKRLYLLGDERFEKETCFEVWVPINQRR